MNDLDRFFRYLGRGGIIKHKITSDGNCFFHALEYALGNCRLSDKKHPYLNIDRVNAADALTEMYQYELERLHRLNSLSDEGPGRIDTLHEKLARLARFRKTSGRLVYSEEEEIYITAYLKQKIIFLIDCAPIPDRNQVQYGFTLVMPDGIHLIEDNIVIMTRTGRIHYDTLNYGQVNGRDNGRIFPANFVEILQTNMRELFYESPFPQVTARSGNLNIFLGPAAFEDPDASARELQSIFNNAEMSQENQNRFLAEQLAEQFQEENRLHAKEPKQTIRIQNKTQIEPLKDTIRIQRKTQIEPFKDTIRIHNQQIQNNFAFAKKIQEQSLPISRPHPRRTLSLNKGPSGLNRTSRSKPRSPRTKRGYFNWFKRLMGPKTRKKR